MPGSSDILRPRLRKAASQLPYLPRTIALVWEATHGWTLLWAGLLVLQGVLPILTVYLTRAVVDRMVVVFRTRAGSAAVQDALGPVALMAGVLLLAEILRSASHSVRAVQSELVRDHIAAQIHRQSIAADMAFYETPDFYDHLHRARAEAGERPIALVETLGSFAQNGITLVAMGAVLIPFGPWLPAALLLSTLPALWVVTRYAVKQREWRDRTTPDERRSWYYDWLLTSGETAAEIRLFGLGGHFELAYQSLRTRLRGERISLAREQALAELAAGAAGLALSGAALGWMALRAARGAVSLGDMALFYQAFQHGLRLMRVLLDNVGQLYANVLFIGNLFEFLSLEPRVASPAAPAAFPKGLGEGIRFERVRFRYPGSGRFALDGFDLFIPAGRLVAVVGPNGAGKSTLVKLLCRFYDPESGSVAIGGVDLRALDTQELRRNITALFQQPVRFNATAAENIRVGDLGRKPLRAEVESAARAAGAEEAIGGLPHGYDTLLGKWFADGAELSVGEWQRVALARAFVKRAPLIVLDEPTSSLDPWAEAEWLTRFRKLAEGRTAVVITHRFTTAMLTDEIHVMSGGRVVESGSHSELVSGGGLYAQWWAAQKIQ